MPTKPFWQSSTIWSFVALFLTSIAQQFGAGDLVGRLIPALQSVANTATPFVLACVQLAALVVGIIGRFNAHKTQVTLTNQNKPGGTLPPRGLTAAALLLLFLLLVLIVPLSLIGCVGTTSPATLTAAESYAWSVADALQTKNVATGQPLDQTLAVNALTAAGLVGPKTTAYAAIGAALINSAIQAGQVAQQAGASGATIQANQSTVLSDPSVIAAAVAQASNPVASP
jgi:hypothetical protein